MFAWCDLYVNTPVKFYGPKRVKGRGGHAPFPSPVKTMTIGEIPDGSPKVAISSPTAITAAFAAAREGYMCDAPRERNGVEYPRFKYPSYWKKND